MEFLKAMRLLGEPARVRILRLLQREELSVAELQEVLGMGQSRISMQLAQLKGAGLVDVRRSGQKSLYRACAPAGAEQVVAEVVARSGAELPDSARDDAALALILEQRKDRLRSYFDELAGRFGRNYVPGRSWKSLAEMLLRLLPPMDIADLGAGEGTIALMLARHGGRVIAVDSSEKMVEYGRAVAERNGLANLDYRVGDMEALPIYNGSVDLALMHQALHHALHPARAVAEAARILRPGGRVVILDLIKHDNEAARDMYADLWLGFAPVDLATLLKDAGFTGVDVGVVDRETEPPHFQTVMATGRKGEEMPGA